MQTITKIPGGVCAPKGFLAGGIHCGIRKNVKKKDLAILYCEKPCTAAAVYTQNKVYGAPITVTRENIADGAAKAVLCNSGNANTCNADGVEKAESMCRMLADALGIEKKDIIIASTGVIGQPLDIEPIREGIAALAPVLSPDGGHAAAEAIMTTDLAVKECAVYTEIGGKTIRIGATAKGSGMIHPNMATLLCFIATDAAISAPMLQTALKKSIRDTFNMVSIDGDTSTNDMASILANGLAGNPAITAPGQELDDFCTALRFVLTDLARKIAADGEGATKLLECIVTGAPDEKTAKTVAKSVITSSLVKTAMFGEDANWGRILCAIGYADADFSIDSIDVYLCSPAGKLQVCQDGFGVAFSEQTAAKILAEKEISMQIDMKQGNACATAWGCDLTYDYVKINGDYRT